MITDLESKQPLFREFCKVKNLKDGDSYKAIEYIMWCDDLTLSQQLQVIRKYHPQFKLKNCSL